MLRFEETLLSAEATVVEGVPTKAEHKNKFGAEGLTTTRLKMFPLAGVLFRPFGARVQGERPALTVGPFATALAAAQVQANGVHGGRRAAGVPKKRRGTVNCTSASLQL